MQTRATLAAAALAITALTGVATSADAASGDPGYVIKGAPVRNAPYNTATVLWYSVGSWVPLQCWKDTQYNGGWYRWFKYSGTNAWVWAGNVVAQPTLPGC